MELLLAKSKAGHDKGKIYVVTSKDKDCCYLADGHLKPLDKPKRKNRKHVQLIINLPQAISDEAEPLEALTDPDVKRILRLYERMYRGETNV